MAEIEVYMMKKGCAETYKPYFDYIRSHIAHDFPPELVENILLLIFSVL
jgi:hypothetical protein